MKSSFREIANLGDDWDFWFSHTKDLPAKDEKKKKLLLYFE